MVQDDVQRKAIWEDNRRMIEDNNQRFFMGMRPFSMAMNKYGDLVRTSFFSVLEASRIKPTCKVLIFLNTFYFHFSPCQEMSNCCFGDFCVVIIICV